MFYNGTKGVVTKVTDLKSPVRPFNSNIKHEPVSSLSGGIISDLDLAWAFNGPILKVFNIAEGTIQSSWDFSSITRDTRTQIRCVIEYPVCDNSRLPTTENQICLVVGYTSKRDASKSSYISFCHPRTSRILHTITTREKITCMSLIATKKDHATPLSGVLKAMSGALAIGTQSGNLLLLDIKDIFNYCRRNSLDSFRNRFSEMTILDLKRMSENDIKDRISKVDGQSNHFAVLLSDKKDSRDPDVEICALTYIPESTCLAVGLKNGSFQLWDVNTLKKLYKSPTLEVHTPVVGFGFQEPCNDPQNFCYLWVLYESESKNGSCLPFAVMYGILYKKVTNISTYGRHYRNFVHCKKRFDLDVDLEHCVSGRCIASSVVSNTPSNILRHAGANEDASKINLFVMIFETWEHNADVNSSISIVVFDMNQWYKAQMPHQCYMGYAVPFVNFMLLERVSERKGSILDVRIKKDTIQQFLSFNLSEEYSYPSSLSFDTIFLADTKIINVRIPGAQRSVLERIISEGPIGLVNPSKYFTECKEAGLRPCFLDSFSHTIVPSQIQQRNYILTILLENKISSFLVRCVKDWADGSRGVSGCTLPNFIQWAWDCISRIKLTTDVICIPLFDYSGDDLDRENYQKLKHCVQLIHIIRDLLVYIYKNFKQFLMDDVKLRHQVDTLLLVTKYFDAIIWCLDCGLLPEKVSGSTEKCVPIYIVNILQYTEQRREELKRMGLNDKYFLIENAPPLIVDAVLQQEPKGKKLQIQWQRESGGMTTGLYPPVTLQSLLRIFLLPDLATDIKHFIVLYFLFDVCDYHRDEEMKEQLLSFSVIFSLDIAYFSLVQACWLLDHEKFEEAVDILTADAVVNQLRKQPLLYKTIMQACVCQKQYGVALKLERLVKLSGVVFPDERFYISLLLQNGLVMEAYTTLKKVSFGQKELLRHFFRVCDDFGLLKEIFKFPISAAEENEFMSYLDESTSRDAGDLKIMYLLSRGRYVEAVDVNHNLASVVPKFEVVGRETTKQNSKTGRVTTRDLLVGAFSKTLPSVTNELISFCRKEKDKIYHFKEVNKPTPLSVVVHTDTSQQIPTYKSSFETVLQAAITKTAETWSSFPKLSKRKNCNASIVKDTPFLRSDIMTPKKDSNLFFSREKADINQTKADVEGPPTKRRKTVLNQTLDIASETDVSELLMSPSVEVTRILTTPHVQKRLNKLLQNTPESSPLPSILKSSEISRFKQPQKVGFNFPISSPTSHKVAVIAETPLKSALKRSAISIAAKKIITDDFVSSPQKRVDVIVENVAVTQQAKVSSPISESLDTSPNADSYYSLESDNEIKDFDSDETASKHSAMLRTNVSHHTFVESMSEEEIVETSKRVIMEVMSEEESAGENQSRQVVVEVHVEPAPLTPPTHVKETHDSQQTFELAVTPVDKTATQLSVAEVSEQQIPSSFVGSQETNEIRSASPQFPILQISSAFTVSSDSQTACDEFESDENVSFATMQPVAAEPVYEHQESNTKAQPSWESIYEEYGAAKRYSNQLSEADVEREDSEAHEEEKNVDVAGSLSKSCLAEDNAESVADEHLEDSFLSRPNDSVTEIQDSSGEDDSDIEILEDESTVAPPRRTYENVDDLSAEDDLSENSYESEYTYSQESGEVESNADDNSIADVEEAVEESDEDAVGGEAQVIEEEYEDEFEDEATDEDDDNDDVEEYDEDEEEDAEVEPEVERHPVSEEHDISTDGGEVPINLPVTVSFDADTLCRENPSINYEELKKIVSNVAAVEAKAEAVASLEVEATKTCESLITSPNLNTSEHELSCEVYDATQSVVEQTVNLDYSDSVIQKSDTSIDLTTNENVTSAENSTEVVGESQKLDTTVEVLSLSAVAKEESTEPPMVFYFGENSVTSIAEEMLINETENSNAMSADQNSQLAGEKTQSETSKAENSVQIADDSAVSMEVEEAYTSQNDVQSESIYIVDIESEVSLEESMAKNRSAIDRSVVSGIEESTSVSHDVSKLKRKDRESSPLFVSTPVSKSTCIRSTATLHTPKDSSSSKKSEESVCVPMSGISEQQTPAAGAPLADAEPRMSVITETISPKTSPKITRSAPITGFLPPEQTVDPVAQSSIHAHISASATSLLQPSSFEQITVEAGQQISKSTSKDEDVSSSNVDSDPVAFVQSSSSETFVAVHPSSLGEQKSSRVDGSSFCGVGQSPAIDEASRLAPVQKSSSPHVSSLAGVKASPTKKLAEEGRSSPHLVSSSIASDPTMVVDVTSQLLGAGTRSSFGSPFAGFESPPEKYIAGKSPLSIFSELLGSHSADPAAVSRSSLSELSASEPDQSVCISEASFPGSAALITSQLSPTKVIEARHKIQQDPSTASGIPVPVKYPTDECSPSSKVQQSSSFDNAPSIAVESTSGEANMDNVEQSSDHSSVSIIHESSLDQDRSRLMVPIVAYTPSPTRISFSQTVRRSPSPEVDAVPQPDAFERKEAPLVCISSSTSPGTSSAKLPSIQPCARTSTIGSVSTEMGQSSPVAAHDLRTPEKIRSSPAQTSSTPPRSSSVISSPQLDSSSPQVYDATYDSHVGVRQLRKDSASSRISSPASSEKTSDPLEHRDEPSDQEDDLKSSRVAPSPRRSVRLARRLSTDSLDTASKEGSESGRSPARPGLRKYTRKFHLADAGTVPRDHAEDDNDDAVSVKSAASAAESVSSRASTASNRSRTRSSFTRLETRKSSVRPSFRPLQVILSDEELTSPTKSEVGAERPSEVVVRKYASSEPGDVSSGSRRSKRSRTSSVTSDEEDLSTGSDRQTKKLRKRGARKQSDKNLLNAAMLSSPVSQKSKSKRLVSSTPMKEEKAPASTAAVSDYTMSRRLTRFQKTLLEGSIRRGEQSDSYDEERMRGSAPALDAVPEESGSVDSEEDFPAGSLRLACAEPEPDESDDDAELTTRAVRNRTITTRASAVRASRGRASKAAAETSAAQPPSADVSSDESVGSRASVDSRASTGSRRRGRSASTFTRMELRRSSARPHFKPLSVIPSDEESTSFQTPPRPAPSAHEDEGLPSSSESTHSKRSTARRSTSSGATVNTRSRRVGSDHSDHDTSSVSDVSSVSTATRRSKRSIAAELAGAAGAVSAAQLKEVPLKSTPIKKRATKLQATVAEPPIKEIPKKRKRT